MIHVHVTDEVIVQVQALILFEFLFIFTAVRYLFVSSYSFLVIVFPSSYLSVQKCRTKERSTKGTRAFNISSTNRVVLIS